MKTLLLFFTLLSTQVHADCVRAYLIYQNYEGRPANAPDYKVFVGTFADSECTTPILELRNPSMIRTYWFTTLPTKTALLALVEQYKKEAKVVSMAQAETTTAAVLQSLNP